MAVIAVGGVGSSLIHVAKALGAGQVIAVDVRDDKLEGAKLMGATDVVNSSKENPVGRILAMTGGRGVDVAFEALGRPDTLGYAMNSVEGRAGGGHRITNWARSDLPHRNEQVGQAGNQANGLLWREAFSRHA